jgi:flavin reductase (DIM6/NTAB) family NADH-FMN oxidoreductase RutF
MTREIVQFDKKWQPGQGSTTKRHLESPKIGFSLDGPDAASNYILFTSGVVPRPVAFIATVDKQGNKNLAPYSFFNVVSSDPPVFAIGTSPSQIRNGDKKDTAANVIEQGELTINFISEDFLDAANYTAVDSPVGYDEFELSGLTPAESKFVKAPHVLESGFSVEAKLINTHTWTSKINGEKTGTLLIVEGVHSWVREDLLNEQKTAIDVLKYRPVGRLGGLNYCVIKDSGYPLTRTLWGERGEGKDEDK